MRSTSNVVVELVAGSSHKKEKKRQESKYITIQSVQERQQQGRQQRTFMRIPMALGVKNSCFPMITRDGADENELIDGGVIGICSHRVVCEKRD